MAGADPVDARPDRVERDGIGGGHDPVGGEPDDGAPDVSEIDNDERGRRRRGRVPLSV